MTNPQTPYNFIAIEGNIGAGKTSLATRMAADSGTRLILEQFADNPFLPKFYENPEQYGFQLELLFLAERYHQLKNEFQKQDLLAHPIISDYSFFKSLIFARANLADGDYELYAKLYNIIHPPVPKPDLLVYLYTDVKQSKANIRKRGRVYEQHISDEYLAKIETSYLEFIKQLPDLRILIIDINEVDFVVNPEDYIKLSNIIRQPYNAGITNVSV